MLKKSWTPCLVLLVSQGVVAQTIPRTALRVDVAPSSNPLKPSKAGTIFVAQHLNVAGASALTQAELLKVADIEPGREMNLRALHQAA